MLVDNDAGAQHQLLGLLSARGHRVVPARAEEAADLAHRLRFDALVWVLRPGGPKWSDFQERLRDSIAAVVLVSDGYDADLAASLAGKRRLFAAASSAGTGTGPRLESSGIARSRHESALNRRLASRQLSQHVRQNSAAAIIFRFLRRIDAHVGFEGFAAIRSAWRSPSHESCRPNRRRPECLRSRTFQGPSGPAIRDSALRRIAAAARPCPPGSSDECARSFRRSRL